MIKHDIHIHTNLSSCSSDPEARPENYIKIAKELGLKVIGFSDHFWDQRVEGASDWYSIQDFDHIMKIKDMMPEDTQGIEVLIGCETEYCGNGKVGISPEIAEKLDFVLVPISHVHMKGFVLPSWINEAKDVARTMVQYFKDVTKLDFVTGIAHPFYPLGYKNVDEIVECISYDEFIECFTMAAENGKSIEINTCFFPGIKGIETQNYHDEIFLNMLSIAKSVGCKFHIGSDAHSLDAFTKVNKLHERIEGLGFTNDDIHPIVRGNI